jgi:hypothetical protein
MLEAYGVTEPNWRDATTRSPHFAISESPAFVGRAVAALAQDPNVSRGNGKALSSARAAVRVKERLSHEPPGPMP